MLSIAAVTFSLFFSFRAPGRETYKRACFTIFSFVFFVGYFDFCFGKTYFIFLAEPTGLLSRAPAPLGVKTFCYPMNEPRDFTGTSWISSSSSSSNFISLLSSIASSVS